MRGVPRDSSRRSGHQCKYRSFARFSTGIGRFRLLLEAPNSPPPQHQTSSGTTSVMWYHICHCHDHDSDPTCHQRNRLRSPSLQRVSSTQPIPSLRSQVPAACPNAISQPTHTKQVTPPSHLRVHAMWSVPEFPLPHGKVLPSHTAILHFYSFHACF